MQIAEVTKRIHWNVDRVLVSLIRANDFTRVCLPHTTYAFFHVKRHGNVFAVWNLHHASIHKDEGVSWIEKIPLFRLKT